jgi:MFS family permease
MSHESAPVVEVNESTRHGPRDDTGSVAALAATAVVVAITQLGFYLTTAALPLYLHDLHAATGRIGIEVGSGNLVAVLITLVLGPGINRFGSRRFLALGAALYLLSAIGMLSIHTEVGVTLFRVVQGSGAAMIRPSAQTLAATLFPERPATVVGAMDTLNSLALAVGPPIGLLLYSGHGATALFVPSAIAAALGLASTRMVPSTPIRRARTHVGFDQRWLPLFLATLLGDAYFGGILSYLPLHLHLNHGPNAGIFFTADAIGVLLLRVPTGIMADRAGTQWSKVIGVLVTIPGIGFLALPPSVFTLAAAGGCTGAGAGLLLTAIMGDLAHQSSDGNRGTAMSLSAAAFSFSMFAGSAISGVLIGPGGFNAVVLFGMLTTAAALPFAFGGGRSYTDPAT